MVKKGARRRSGISVLASFSWRRGKRGGAGQSGWRGPEIKRERRAEMRGITRLTWARRELWLQEEKEARVLRDWL
jgi:hypothetical protein